MQFTFALLTAAAMLTPVYSHGTTPKSRGIKLKFESCTTSQQAVVEAALQRAATLSTTAADAAINGDASRFEEYFRTTDTASRQEVAARYEAIANEAGSLGGGNITYNCGNGLEQSDCGDGVLAYALGNKVVTCPAYYKVSSAISSCGGTDQGITMIHELSHIAAVHSPGTGDHAYKYDSIITLSKEKAIVNADTYLHYAGALDLDCQAGDSKAVQLPDWMVAEIVANKNSN
ncbi:hypothetical protein N7536_000501 [Penicillium majusculum]|uniref:Neutral protease 2 n=1 Tax=Penicillium solitum TaxID=60172 RepID=A0A1V6QTM3_9EURO|nr:uncharacterized protein PENSOL_c040G03274 [Penicillium solitum]KAJ5704812.1 hypothetical protein N7536_000501 [Penicillium majusculum]OQD92565.1 hypothetical protein PENSOL_c040G03274 [Penicillium solitum]